MVAATMGGRFSPMATLCKHDYKMLFLCFFVVKLSLQEREEQMLGYMPE